MPAVSRAPRPGEAELRAAVAGRGRLRPDRARRGSPAATCCARSRPALPRPCPWCCRRTAAPCRPRSILLRRSVCRRSSARGMRSSLGTMAALPRLLCASSAALVVWGRCFHCVLCSGGFSPNPVLVGCSFLAGFL